VPLLLQPICGCLAICLQKLKAYVAVVLQVELL
jgi:hypothetical protein